VKEALAYSIDESCKALGGMSRQTFYDLINQGRIRTFKEGRRRFVSRSALQEYVNSREAEELKRRQLS